MTTYTLDGDDFTRMCCGNCGIRFYVPSYWQKEKQETGKGWHCPNGHPRVYSVSDADKLRRERDRLKQQLAEKDDAVRRERERAEGIDRSRAAYMGQVTKLKTRAKNGVCPCCNRQFKNLQSHMANKHPDFESEAKEDAA